MGATIVARTIARIMQTPSWMTVSGYPALWEYGKSQCHPVLRTMANAVVPPTLFVAQLAHHAIAQKVQQPMDNVQAASMVLPLTRTVAALERRAIALSRHSSRSMGLSLCELQ